MDNESLDKMGQTKMTIFPTPKDRVFLDEFSMMMDLKNSLVEEIISEFLIESDEEDHLRAIIEGFLFSLIMLVNKDLSIEWVNALMGDGRLSMKKEFLSLFSGTDDLNHGGF